MSAPYGKTQTSRLIGANCELTLEAFRLAVFVRADVKGKADIAVFGELQDWLTGKSDDELAAMVLSLLVRQAAREVSGFELLLREWIAPTTGKEARHG